MSTNYTGLDHVGFTVSGLDRSIPFYTFLLGSEPVGRILWEPPTDEFVGRIVGYPGLKLEGDILAASRWHRAGATPIPPSANGQGEHGDLQRREWPSRVTTDDIWAEFERLRNDVQFRNSEPVQIPSGPAQGGWAIYLRIRMGSPSSSCSLLVETETVGKPVILQTGEGEDSRERPVERPLPRERRHSRVAGSARKHVGPGLHWAQAALPRRDDRLLLRARGSRELRRR